MCPGSYKTANLVRSVLGETGHCTQCALVMRRADLAGERKENMPRHSALPTEKQLREELLKCL